ncbi:MAG: NADH-quinone oxidoreductase subunit J [Chloroflexota bacterium]
MGLIIAFWILAVAAVAAALGVVLLRNVFRAALSLILCFLAVAGLYVTLSADFLAAIQILVYVGAISVLIIIAIMMTRDYQRGSPFNRMVLPGFIVVAVLLGVLIFTLTSTPWQIAGTAPVLPTTALLAEKLFGAKGFILPVEIGAALLLAAIIGAVVLARENDKE